MNCLQAEEHFSAHFEDTLGYQALQDFEAHLTGCEACQHEYDRFQEAIKAVQQLPQIEPSRDFIPKLHQRLAEEDRELSGIKEMIATAGQRLQNVFHRPRWAFSGIVALILIAGGGYFYQAGLFSDPDPQPAVVVTPASEPVRIRPAPLELPIDIQRQARNLDPFLPSGVNSTSTQPMQQRYVLKQVSFTNTSTRGGL